LLEEIGIYTYEDTTSLSVIFDFIANKENGNKCLSHKSEKNTLLSYFREILPDYDEERVYYSDIKKVIQWYNLMHDTGLIIIEKKEKKKLYIFLEERITEDRKRCTLLPLSRAYFRALRNAFAH
jgi:hypothetical protein